MSIWHKLLEAAGAHGGSPGWHQLDVAQVKFWTNMHVQPDDVSRIQLAGITRKSGKVLCRHRKKSAFTDSEIAPCQKMLKNRQSWSWVLTMRWRRQRSKSWQVAVRKSARWWGGAKKLRWRQIATSVRWALSRYGKMHTSYHSEIAPWWHVAASRVDGDEAVVQAWANHIQTHGAGQTQVWPEMKAYGKQKINLKLFSNMGARLGPF